MPDLTTPHSTCSTVQVTPGTCCYGACLDGATHAIVTADSGGHRLHHRCPTHLQWSQEQQTVEAVTEL